MWRGSGILRCIILLFCISVLGCVGDHQDLEFEPKSDANNNVTLPDDDAEDGDPGLDNTNLDTGDEVPGDAEDPMDDLEPDENEDDTQTCIPRRCEDVDDACGELDDECGSTVNCGECVPNLVMVSAGESHTCAIWDNGRVDCWGKNHHGQLGDGTSEDKNRPMAVTGLVDAAEVFAGSYHSCAILNSGEVKCWGRNDYGQLGVGNASGEVSCEDSTKPCHKSPVGVVGLAGVMQLALGDFHSCALLDSAKVTCWGRNDSGQLGDALAGEVCGASNRACRTLPREVPGLSNVKHIAAGAIHSCAVASTGHIKCWGNNEFGQLGNGTSTSFSGLATVHGISNAQKVLAQGHHSCAIQSDGVVKCWGRSESGSLGRVPEEDTTACGPLSFSCVLTPSELAGLEGIKQLALGILHSCAILENGIVQCWGDNRQGGLGVGSLTPLSSTEPLTVVGVTDGVDLSLGLGFGCALVASGELHCWGNNVWGQLGDGTNTRRPGAVPVKW